MPAPRRKTTAQESAKKNAETTAKDDSTKPWLGLAIAFAVLFSATSAYVLVIAPRTVVDAPPVCGATAELLEGMNQELTIDVYVTPVDGPTKRLATRLRAMMTRYREAAKGKLTFDMFEGDDEQTRARAEIEGLRAEEYAPEGGAPKRKVFAGIAFTYAGEHDTLTYVSPDEREELGLQYWISSKIRELVRRVDGPPARIGVLGGHGEPRLDAPDLVPGGAYAMSSILAQNFPDVSLVDVDLEGGARAVDPSLGGLLVLQPATDITDPELARIDDFVMQGRALVVFAGAVNVAPGNPAMPAKLATHGLEKLTAAYGIDLATDVVFDYGDCYETPALADLAPRSFPDMPLLIDSGGAEDSFLDATFPPFAPLHGIVAPFASSLTTRPADQPGARVRVVARTSSHASRSTTPDVSLDPEQWGVVKPEQGHERFDVGAVAEGKLRSALSGKTAAAPARVFVLASSSFLANPFARAGDGAIEQEIGTAYAKALVTPLVLALRSTLDWMSLSPEQAACDEGALAW